MGSYADWTKEEVLEKADWEGGIEGLLYWGGADAFEALGPEAYAAAQRMVADIRLIQQIFNEIQDGVIDAAIEKGPYNL